MWPQKPRTEMSSLKRDRLENKKRKVKAFLELASQDTGYLTYRKKRFINKCYNSEEDPDCSLESLRAKVREIKKRKGPPPSFELSETGIQAQLSYVESQLTTVPLYIGDVQQLLLKAVLNIGSPCRPRWCSIQQSHAIRNVILVVVEGLSKDAVLENLGLFQNVTTNFNNMVEMVTPCRYSSTFAAELCEMSLIFCYEVIPNTEIKNWNMAPCNTHKALSYMVPVIGDQTCKRDPDEGFSRLHLLLSPIQMAMENFPLPQDVFACANTKDYKMTKDVYSEVTSKSPMFAIDCEMCRVVSGRMEVTRVAIVDEELNTIYCTLVKPREKVTDYVTKFSGVTEKMLRPVTTTLGDVQNKIKELLPPDAIICGQSVNFDLHALKVIHPYIIDTSVIYNTSGCRTRKTALKVLSSTFLKEKIQNSEEGHHPVEDCIAAMKLVQLKLQNGPQFGDSILTAKVRVKTEPDGGDVQNTSNDSGVQKSKNPVSTSFFAQFPAEKKSSLIIVTDDFSELYPEKMLNEAVTKETFPSNKKVLKHTLQEMSKHDLTISHLRFPTRSDYSESLSKIDKCLGKLYEACSTNSALIFVGTGLMHDDGRCENGFCQVKIKDQ